jgi:hypothetical protein
MAKFLVTETIAYNQGWIVEAETEGEAIDLVANGDCDPDDDNFVEFDDYEVISRTVEDYIG